MYHLREKQKLATAYVEISEILILLSCLDTHLELHEFMVLCIVFIFSLVFN